jgi:AcrR family transcriptional regulator
MQSMTQTGDSRDSPAPATAPAAEPDPGDRHTSDRHTGDPADTKSRALAIALDLFSRNGYDATSMREISEQLGVTKAALYYHFAGKEDLVRGILEEFMGSVDAVVTWATSSEKPSPEAVLRRWAELMRVDGMRLMRFMQANQRIVRDLQPEGHGTFPERLVPLFDALSEGDKSLGAQVRARAALFALQGTAAFSGSLDATDAEVFDEALIVAVGILRRTD